MSVWLIVCRNNQDTLDFLKSYRPRNHEASHLRILLIGPSGDGKSTFINSVDSVLQGRVANRAPTDQHFTADSFTKKVCMFVFIYLFFYCQIMTVAALNKDLWTPSSVFSTKHINSPKAMKVITHLFSMTSWAWKGPKAFMWKMLNLP